jgi:hypothetical protein
MTEDDVVISIATDSADMYQSRIDELNSERGKYNEVQAARDFEKCLLGATTDHMKEFGYYDRKAVHNLKYFTWIEQQAKELEDLNQLWDDREVWNNIFNQVHRWDELINEFNDRTGLLK